MSIERVNFDDISEADLDALIRAGKPEGRDLEYKRDPYGNRDVDKKEALKDITSFANSAGGHLIIGMEQTKGIPTGLKGLPDEDLDGLRNRLESLIRDGVEPRIVGVRIRPVSLSSGGVALVIRIPKSWNPPHRVSTGGTNRFYVRNSGGVHEASVEEPRVLFNLAADAQERIKTFRSDRIATIKAGCGPFLLPAKDRLFVHLVPLSAFSQAAPIDLKRAAQLCEKFRPLASMGMTMRFNLDGIINLTGGEDGYTQVFRNGIVEATWTDIIRDWQGMTFFLPGISNILDVLPDYFEGLLALDVPTPTVVMISYEGIEGARLGKHYGWRSDAAETAPFPPVDPLQLPEIIVEDYGSPEHYRRALRPAFDALWNAAGFRRCDYYNSNGDWQPAQ
jgi:hypothetical protein